jgi:hypothetical protein
LVYPNYIQRRGGSSPEAAAASERADNTQAGELIPRGSTDWVRFSGVILIVSGILGLVQGRAAATRRGG